MSITIYSSENKPLIKNVPITSSSEIIDEYMGARKVHLVWVSSKFVSFGIGSYVEVNSQKYYIYTPYSPSQTSEGKYSYDVSFLHPRSYIDYVPMTFSTNDASGATVILTDWAVTNTAKPIFEYICRCIEKAYSLDSGTVSLSIIGEVNASATCSFANKTIGEAISEACTQFNCECFYDYDHQILYVGSNLQLNAGETADLVVGKNIGALTISKNTSQGYNNFLVRGGTKNMSTVTASGGNIATNTRLTLDPAKYQNSEIFVGQNGEPKVTKILSYDEIYPHAEFYVYNVRGWKRYMLDDDKKKIAESYNDDGTVKSYKTYTVWFMRLATPIKDKDGNVTSWIDFKVTDDMILENLTLSCSFIANIHGKHSALAGRDFELTYHKDAMTEASSDSVDGAFEVLAGDFEIVFSEENSIIIPTNAEEGLYPYGLKAPDLKSDIVQIYNVVMPDEYKQQAYQDLAIAAFIDIHKIQRDFGSLETKVYPSAFKGEQPLTVKVGNAVTVRDGNTRTIESRITKIVQSLAKPNVVTLTVSNDVTLTTKEAINSNVTTLKNQISAITSGSNDSATNADTVRKIIDVYGGSMFLSKKSIDIAQKLITFLEGINAKGTSTLEAIEVLNKVTNDFVKVLFSHDYNAGTTGFGIYRDADGNYHLDIDFVNIRKKLEAKEVEIHEERYIGGTMWLTVGGGMVITDVKAGTINFEGVTRNGWYCYYRTKDPATGETIHNLFDDYDQILCQTFNLQRDRNGNTSNRYYWRLMLTTSTKSYDMDNDEGWIFLANDTEGEDYISSSDVPCAGDKIVQVGNRKNKNRQGAIRLSAITSAGGPVIEEFRGIDSFRLPDPKIKLSPSENYLTGTFVSEDGTNINEAVADVSNRIHIYYGYGIPSLATTPASEWMESEYSSHDQDIYFDISREPASYGGRAYKFMLDASTGVWGWKEVDDADTISALNLASDIANDGKITGGAEKSRLLVEWLKAHDDVVRYTEQADDYDFPNDDMVVSGTDTFKSIYDGLVGANGAWTELCKYLNAGVSLSKGKTPAWIADDMLQTTTKINADIFRQRWNAYYTAMALMLKAITYKSRILADAAQDTADKALESIAEIAKDGKLTPSEKVTIKREFIACYNEKNNDGGLIDKSAASTSDYWNIDGTGEYMSEDVKTACEAYIHAFRDLGHYLNGDTYGGGTWSANPTASSHNGASAWTEQTTIVNANLPAWLQDANMAYTEDITASDFQGYWNDFYTARTALLTALTDNALTTASTAQKSADIAQDTADRIASDSVLSGGWEKMDVYIEWMRCKNEYTKYSVQANDLGVSYSDFNAAFNDVGDLLNGKWFDNGAVHDDYQNVDWANSTDLPVWLSNLGEDTPINADKYKTVWSAYSTALSELLSSIGKALQEVVVPQIDTSENIPSAPYKKGDYWRKPTTLTNPYTGDTYTTDENGNQLYDLYLCVNDCAVGGTPKMSDWQVQDQASRYFVSNTAKGLYNVIYGSDRKSGMVTTLNSVNAFVEKWTTADDGSLLYNGSKMVLESNYASLFTQMCNENGDVLSEAGIATFVTSDGNKYLSGVKIYGDDISFDASHKLTINGDYFVVNSSNFTIDENGDVNVKGKIEAMSGYIGGNRYYNYQTGKYENVGGFMIEGNGLTNIVPQSSMNKSSMAYIICRNDYYGRFAGIGANVLPAATGSSAVARFENKDTHGWYDSNIAMLLSARNGAYNYAFLGTGNGILDGDIFGYAFQKMSCKNGVITEIDISKGTKVLFTNNTSNTGLALPMLYTVRRAIGDVTASSFAIVMHLVQGYGGTVGDVIYGKNNSIHSSVKPSGTGNTYTITNKDGSKTYLTVNSDGSIKGENNGQTATFKSGSEFDDYWMNNNEFPQIYNDNKNNVNCISMGIGDCLCLMLVYNDGVYGAYWINKNW